MNRRQFLSIALGGVAASAMIPGPGPSPSVEAPESCWLSYFKDYDDDIDVETERKLNEIIQNLPFRKLPPVDKGKRDL